MSDREILEKAIQKAIDGGWAHELLSNPFTKFTLEDNLLGFYDDVSVGNTIEHLGLESLNNIIFNHDFAKVLWGEEVLQNPTPLHTGSYRTEDTYIDAKEQLIKVKPLLLAWQFHLQQMVIAEDPIKYLGDHLE